MNGEIHFKISHSNGDNFNFDETFMRGKVFLLKMGHMDANLSVSDWSLKHM